MRIGLLTAGDPRSRATWSGTIFSMAAALERHGGPVVPLGPVSTLRNFGGRVANRASRLLTGRPYDYHHSVGLSRAYARRFREMLAAAPGLDVIVAPAAAAEIAFLETDVPIVYTSDATYDSLCGYYPELSNVRAREMAEGNRVEQQALDRARTLVFCSEWAAASARTRYGAPAAKVHVLPYGANLDRVPEADRVEPPRHGPCTLAFIGVDWHRKGGPLALEATRLLRQRGLDARLVVVGCMPPVPPQPWLRVVPRLDKTDPAQAAEFSRILLESRFLLVPTRYECFGIVYCEASAHGRPSAATATGGVGSAVREGENGFLLPPGAEAGAYADRIAEILADPGGYEALARSSRRAYEERLNWDAWGRRMREHLDAAV